MRPGRTRSAPIVVAYGGPPVPDRLAGYTGAEGLLRFHSPYTDTWLKATQGGIAPSMLQFAIGPAPHTEIKAGPGRNAAWEIRTYGKEYDANWHGVVQGPDGRPAAHVHVQIVRASGGATLVTDAQGRFSARLMRLGPVEATPGPTRVPPVAYAWRGGLAAARVVTPAESWHGMTLRLAPGAALSGALTDSKEQPVAGVGISATGRILGNSYAQALSPRTVTDAAGRFSLAGLPAGQYQILTHGGGFGDLRPPGDGLRLGASDGECHPGRRTAPRPGPVGRAARRPDSHRASSGREGRARNRLCPSTSPAHTQISPPSRSLTARSACPV